MNELGFHRPKKEAPWARLLPCLARRGNRARGLEQTSNGISATLDRRLQRFFLRPFTTGAGPLSGPRRTWSIAGNHGDRLLRLAGLARSHIRCAARRIV